MGNPVKFMKFKPFTKTEMKMLVFNKVKGGMTYDNALLQLNMEIKEMKEIFLAQRKLKENTFDGIDD